MTTVTTQRPPTKSLSHISSQSIVNHSSDEATPRFINTTRFTIDGHPPLEASLDSICQKLAASLSPLIPPNLLDGLVLAGGYGRGEGGVLLTPGGERPYNDLEFYLYLKGNRLLNQRTYGPKLQALCDQLTQTVGLDVELKLDTLARLRSGPVSMFSYDLCIKHRIILGSPDLFSGCEHHLDARAIPLEEATRLLFNRCSGLLFAQERLSRSSFTADDADFVTRNLAKLQMALGDTLLTASGHYHWSCRERDHRFRELISDWEQTTPDWAAPLTTLFKALIKNHNEGVIFKLHPYRDQQNHPSRATLQQRFNLLKWLSGQVWLALESHRLSRPFKDHPTYALSTHNKCPDQPLWRNLLVNARDFGFPTSRYPRERLYHALSLLLWSDPTQPTHLATLQHQLSTRATTPTALIQAYEALWIRFN